jgi:hypothetical protein
MLTIPEMSDSPIVYSVDWVNLLRFSLLHYTDRHLAPPELDPHSAAQFIFDAPYMLVSHDKSIDPIFNYGNRTALDLFAMNWDEFTSIPSRLSAEPVNQQERSRLLARVTTYGFIDDYTGIRISKTGKRFRLENAIVWNAIDADGNYHGQAAICDRWV